MILFALSALSLTAQKNPVRWEFTTKKVSNSLYDLIFTAKIDEGWYVYSEFLPSEDGPIPTSIDLAFVPGIEPIDPPEESGDRHEGHDSIFDMEVIKFSRTFQIVQRISVSEQSPKQISGTIRYMSCDSNQCLPPRDEDFTFVLQ